MMWQNINPVGYSNKEAYYRLIVCYLIKCGLKYPLKTPEYCFGGESFLLQMKSAYFEYSRSSLDFESYGYYSLNENGYVTYDCYDFFQACIHWIDFEKMELLSDEQSDERIEEYYPGFYEELESEHFEEEEEWERCSSWKQIASCILAIYQNDKENIKRYKDDFLENSYQPVYKYTETLIQDLGKMVGVKKKIACKMLPYLLSFFTFPLNGMEESCEYGYTTNTGERGVIKSDVCRMLQVFHLKNVSNLKKILTKDEVEELLHPVNSWDDEKCRKVINVGKNDIYVVYTSFSLDLNSVPASFSNVNPAAVAVGLKLKDMDKKSA